jgi:ribosomal protein S18 acetylase RimI-like enzyme
VTQPGFRIRTASSADLAAIRSAFAYAIEWRSRSLSATPDTVIRVTGHDYLLSEWGRDGDVAVVAQAGSRIIGAAWYRFWSEAEHSYGYVDPDTPELGIGVDPDCRRIGVGAALLTALLEVAEAAGIARISLSVEADNPAMRLYEKVGFAPHAFADGSWTMVKVLRD